MDRILNILNNEDTGFDVKIEKSEKRKKKRKIKSVEVVPLSKDKDDYTDPPHPNLLRLPFSLLEIAQKGSGKTVLLHNLMVWYAPYFDNIFVWSPTVNLDSKWKDLIKELKLPPENLFVSYKEAQVSNVMRQIKDFNQGIEDRKERVKCLLVFDDIIQDLPKGRRKTVLNKLAMNHRHYDVSHIIISQSFKKVDSVMRSNTTGMILFNTDNTAERMKIIEELAGNIGRKEFERLWYECTKEKHSFMFINYDSRLVFRKFDEVVADLDTMPKLRYQKLSQG